jgi:hypothetical protein
MPDPRLVVAGLPAERVTTVPGLVPTRRSVAERDEFGPLDGAPGLFRTPAEPAGLAAREDLGHGLCAWLPREDLL